MLDPLEFGQLVKQAIDKSTSPLQAKLAELDQKLAPDALGGLIAGLVADACADRDAKIQSLERRASRLADHVATLETKLQRMLREANL
ncbi:MAG: hypothetical protein U1F41_05795 [Burkholderiales bacterium]